MNTSRLTGIQRVYCVLLSLVLAVGLATVLLHPGLSALPVLQQKDYKDRI